MFNLGYIGKKYAMPLERAKINIFLTIPEHLRKQAIKIKYKNVV
jgi:hypothetical protein